MATPAWWVDLGERPYRQVLDLQLALVGARRAGRGQDTLLLCSHPPVITLGRATPQEVQPPAGLEVHRVGRGGALTWHEPGQLVGYPIVRLSGGAGELGGFMRGLERGLIEALARLGIQARRGLEEAGVWVAERKIASIGVAVRGWITHHGFALCLENDAALLEGLRPCGNDPRVMTSVHELIGPCGRERVRQLVVAGLGAALGRAFECIREEALVAAFGIPPGGGVEAVAGS